MRIFSISLVFYIFSCVRAVSVELFNRWSMTHGNFLDRSVWPISWWCPFITDPWLMPHPRRAVLSNEESWTYEEIQGVGEGGFGGVFPHYKGDLNTTNLTTKWQNDLSSKRSMMLMVFCWWWWLVQVTGLYFKICWVWSSHCESTNLQMHLGTFYLKCKCRKGWYWEASPHLHLIFDIDNLFKIGCNLYNRPFRVFI